MKYLKVYSDFLDVTESLNNASMGRMFRAMLAYARDSTVPDLQGKEGVLWAVAQQMIDREREAYEDKVSSMERCREARKQKEAMQKSMQKPMISKEDKDKEKDKDKDKDKDIYIGAAAPAPKAHIYIHPPTVEEIGAYCQERGNQVDPQYFYNYYQANGWRVGKNPMRDWKAAVCAWETNGMAERMAPAREPSVSDNFKKAMELLKIEEAKQV